jgi:hypothetical protein
MYLSDSYTLPSKLRIILSCYSKGGRQQLLQQVCPAVEWEIICVSYRKPYLSKLRIVLSCYSKGGGPQLL